MVKFVFEDATTTVQRLAEWIEKDPYHQGSVAENWIQDSLVSCWVCDSKGPVMFLRAEAGSGETVRLHIQFAPSDEVSKLRQAKAILAGWSRLVDTIAVPGVKAIVFQSVSPTLIAFMVKLGFVHWTENEYGLLVREQ